MYPYIDIGSVRFGTYGISAAVGFFVAWRVFRADLIRRNLPGRLGGIIVVSVTLTGLAGAKALFLLETPAALRQGILHGLLQSSGLAWLGGLLAGTGALCFISLSYKLPLLTLFDMAAPIGAVVYAFGRIGCLLAGDGDYGKPTALPWGMTFPHGIVPVFEPVHPTPIYEAFFSAALFCLLWKLGSGPRPRGMVAGIYLFLSGAARFLVEFIRLNPPRFLGLTDAQLLSLISIIAGAALVVSVRLKADDWTPIRPVDSTTSL